MHLNFVLGESASLIETHHFEMGSLHSLLGLSTQDFPPLQPYQAERVDQVEEDGTRRRKTESYDQQEV